MPRPPRPRPSRCKRGVCQDITHIFIASARQLGIPARYVSGYFHRADGVNEQQAGHAWAEAFVEHLGWVGFDPTNGIGTTDAHLRVAVGLDYLGAAPVRGTRFGGDGESLEWRCMSIRRTSRRKVNMAHDIAGHGPAVGITLRPGHGKRSRTT